MHMTNCIPHARRFTTRLLATLRALHSKLWTTLTPEAKLDITWFLKYSELGNGISLLTSEMNPFEIKCDASLHGGGGCSHSAYYKWKFSSSHAEKYTSIHELEAINLLVAFKTLSPTPVHSQINIVIYTDNMASSYALMTGKTKDTTLGACARQIWLEAANRHLHFTIKHRPGVELTLADALSRYHSDDSKANLAEAILLDKGLVELPPVLGGYNFDLTL